MYQELLFDNNAARSTMCTKRNEVLSLLFQDIINKISLEKSQFIIIIIIIIMNMVKV
jgi:hypothetical protein